MAWAFKSGHYLRGYTSKGHSGGQWTTLEKAKQQCLALESSDCGGITRWNDGRQDWFQLRRETVFLKSPTGEDSWKRPLQTTETDWTEFTIGNKKTYLKLIGKTRLDQALKVCQQFNAKLPLPKNEQEDTDLYKAFQALGVNGGAVDGNDVAKEGKWVDSSGQALTYTNWYPGQPSNHDIENYLEYAANELKGQWNDADHDHVSYLVCERPVPSKTF